MDHADRDLVSHYLGVRPTVSCASGLSQVKRKRHLWASWKMLSWEGVALNEETKVWALTFQAALPPSSDWASPGWSMAVNEDVRYPTFMRAIPKKKETYLPSGIASTPADARKRWKAHQWRYPPYQYKKRYCLRRDKAPHDLRVPNSEEREVLMFLGRGATRYALNPTKAKLDPQALEDARCSLIGNSFHAGGCAMVLRVLFEKKKRLAVKPTTQEIVSRQGLHPGEMYTEGLVCHLRRPATYHRLDGQRRGHCANTFTEARAAQSADNNPELERITLNALLRSADL